MQNYGRTSGLASRRERPALFTEGEYIPLEVAGDEADHVIAFARRQKSEWLQLPSPRAFRCHFLEGVQTPLVPPERWTSTRVTFPASGPVVLRDLVTGRAFAPSAPLAVGDLLSTFPVAFLSGG